MPVLTPDATYSTLKSIIQDIRELSRSISPVQISDAKIMYWINTFMLYDMPAILRLSALKTTFTFFTNPYQDIYQSTFDDPTDPFYNFLNTYVTTHRPFYCAGYLGEFMQSREQFFGLYPNVNFIQLVSYGNGATTRFPGVINAASPNMFQPQSPNQTNVCLVRGQVLFNSIDSNNNGLAMADTPINATYGNLSVPNTSPTSLIVQDLENYINYLTGQFVVTFMNSGGPVAPGQGQIINSQSIPVAPAQPQTLLWFDDKIYLRPVPDQVYRCTVEAFIRPTQLLLATDMPKLAQWYQYIVYGTATKIFQMRGDQDSADRIAPEFKKQELLVQRTTIVQQSKNRVPTIFVAGNGAQFNPGFGFNGNTVF